MKYTVTRACGHEEIVALVGKVKNREWRLENVEPSKFCHDCYQAELARQREKENREAAEVARENNLPGLTGTEKQIAWAESIRQQLLADIDEFIYKQIKAEYRNDPKLLEAIKRIKSKTNASWWIDNRGMKTSYEFKQLLEDASREVKTEKIQPIIDAAKVEATIRPENAKTESVAEIRALKGAIEISFPEKRDDFWGVVKRQLNMEWTGRSWRRNLKARNGTPQDRVAEAGHKILAAGFPIRIYDANIRAMTISGEYEPECTRWVQKRTTGEYMGWFAITWDNRKGDFYKVAKAIGGSRYSKPSVVVPPESFEEVLDFAKMYGFKLSDAAMEVAETARRTREATLTVKVDAPKKQHKVMVSGKPPVLEVPTEVGVDDEFKD